MKTAVVFISLLCAAMAIKMSPEDMDLQNQIWENTNVVEGDILVLPNTERLAATTRESAKWKNKEIPYNIDRSLDFMKDTILKSIWHIQNKTCLRFREAPTEKARVRMIYSYGMCNSYVGWTGLTQPLRLYERCNDIGSITHELLHAAGFYHEHMRSDRDGYIRINWQNIATENYSQFKKKKPSENILLNNFDYDSIMLYGEFNGNIKAGLKAMESIRPGKTFISPSKKNGLSAGDAAMVDKYYDC